MWDGTSRNSVPWCAKIALSVMIAYLTSIGDEFIPSLRSNQWILSFIPKTRVHRNRPIITQYTLPAMPTPLELMIPSTTSPESSPTHAKSHLKPQLSREPSRAAVARMQAIEMEGYLDVFFTYVECIGRLLKRLFSYAISIMTFLYTSIVIRLGLVVVSAIVIYYYVLVSDHKRERALGVDWSEKRFAIDQNIIQSQLGLGKISGVNDPKLHGMSRGRERGQTEGEEGQVNKIARMRESLLIAHDAYNRIGMARSMVEFAPVSHLDS
jgi:hypothetical protein